jgi:hypothetical protein
MQQGIASSQIKKADWTKIIQSALDISLYLNTSYAAGVQGMNTYTTRNPAPSRSAVSSINEI